jgi:hypothetical protein
VTGRPRLTGLNLWKSHETQVLETLLEALMLLAGTEGCECQDEPELNRRLFFCLREANRNRYLRGEKAFDYPPTWEARNPPSPSDSKGVSRERKIPDFYYGYEDHHCLDPVGWSRYFVIECKRLGVKSSSGWRFVDEYVVSGIVRFVKEEWGYGKDSPAGAMVGYVQSLSFQDASTEVNAVAQREGVVPLALRTSPEESIQVSDHLLDRPFAHSPFNLIHLWVDLNNACLNSEAD